jgi:hypothetical protein
MRVPETTMHEHGNVESLQDKIWSARQIAPVEAESEARSMKPPTDYKLRLCILAPDA